jgi:hypothetical protein
MEIVPMTSRRARWAVPAGAVAVVAAVTAASMATAAAASPALPARSPAQLLSALAGHAAAPPQMSGTVVESAALGIPQLPGQQDPSSPLSMMSGSHTIKVWYSDPAHFRLALPVPLGETDVIRNGGTGWVWQSSSDSVQRVMLPARPGGVPASPATGAGSAPASLTPQQAAQRLLRAVGPSTGVTSGPTTTVAGQDAYQLVVAPKDSRSLVGRVVFEVDAQHPGVVLGTGCRWPSCPLPSCPRSRTATRPGPWARPPSRRQAAPAPVAAWTPPGSWPPCSSRPRR